ncbi:hypothetical protein [Nocardia camponoti]|uniref:hypothetical protein n=1 Tax=Nocardia camponoti TaxID=1616106 RepID=UPI001668E56C|nr:hypothetical protein [Nocardia camponoti]
MRVDGPGDFRGEWAHWVEPEPDSGAVSESSSRAPAFEHPFQPTNRDDAFARMLDRSRQTGPFGLPRWAAPLAASVAAAALIGGAYLQFGGPAPESTSSSTPLPNQVVAGGTCPTEHVGSRFQSNGPGGSDSGIAAILAFQHAYYVARSGELARASVAPDMTAPSSGDIQAGIDTIPVGTTHCLNITPAAFAGQYYVVITEYRPDSVPIQYNAQLVGTTKVGDKSVISSIGPVRGQ